MICGRLGKTEEEEEEEEEKAKRKSNDSSEKKKEINLFFFYPETAPKVKHVSFYGVLMGSDGP